MTAASATARMAHERVLERDRRDPLAARLDEVLRAVLHLDEAVGVDGHDVAGPEPAVVRPAVGALLRLEVRGRDRRATHLELAHRLAVPGDEAVGAAGADLDERDREPLQRAPRVRLVLRQAGLLAGSARDRPDRAHLGHAPAVDDMEAVTLAEGLDHRARRRGAADGHEPDRGEVPLARVRVERLEDPHPDRRDARGHRDLLLRKAVEQRLGIHVRAREDLLDAGQRAGEREAPRVRVEHRDDGQADVVGVEAERREHGQRVERDRAVRVEDALRPAGGAARVAHRRRGVLREVAVRELGLVRVGEELLVVDRRRPASGRRRPR